MSDHLRSSSSFFAVGLATGSPFFDGGAVREKPKAAGGLGGGAVMRGAAGRELGNGRPEARQFTKEAALKELKQDFALTDAEAGKILDKYWNE